jgi:hypothetical protein
MAENPEDTLAWLDSLTGASDSEPEQEEETPAPELPRGVFGSLMDSMASQADEEDDLVDDLRDQFATPDAGIGYLGETERPGLVRTIRALQPWQRFVLTLLLFLDLLVCGAMLLVMTGRVWLF